VTRGTAVLIAWLGLLATIVALSGLAIWAKMRGIDLQGVGFHEAIGGLIGLLGVALSAQIHNSRRQDDGG